MSESDIRPALYRTYARIIELTSDDPFDWTTKSSRQRIRANVDKIGWTVIIKVFTGTDEDDNEVVDGVFKLRTDRLSTFACRWSEWADSQPDIESARNVDPDRFVDLFYDRLTDRIEQECNAIKENHIDLRRGYIGMVERERPDLDEDEFETYTME